MCKSGTAGSVPAQDKGPDLDQRNHGNYWLTRVWSDRCRGKKNVPFILYITDDAIPPQTKSISSHFKLLISSCESSVWLRKHLLAKQSNSNGNDPQTWRMRPSHDGCAYQTASPQVQDVPLSVSLLAALLLLETDASFSIPDWIDSPSDCTQLYEGLEPNIVQRAQYLVVLKCFWKHERYASCIEMNRNAESCSGLKQTSRNAMRNIFILLLAIYGLL